MEQLILNFREHGYLQRHKQDLEKEYKVEINLPEEDKHSAICSSDIVFASISGQENDIETVKNLLKERSQNEQCLDVITLSDSSDSDVPVCLDNDISPETKAEKKDRCASGNCLKNSFSVCRDCKKERKRNRHKMRLLWWRIQKRSVDPIVQLSSHGKKKKGKKRKVAEMDFNFPTHSAAHAVKNISAAEDSTLLEEPRLLRPIVIDGSSVARAHGRPTKTFSCKGIQICIDYFLNRGHSQVTAFVPDFRIHTTQGLEPTTDLHILEDLGKMQRVVFTPSRDGREVTREHHRFIVEQAASNGGVILTNAGYTELQGTSEAFDQVLKERLLMYCFADDLLMIPQDPMGRTGPGLNEFLSFSTPKSSKQHKPSSSQKPPKAFERQSKPLHMTHKTFKRHSRYYHKASKKHSLSNCSSASESHLSPEIKMEIKKEDPFL